MQSLLFKKESKSIYQEAIKDRIFKKKWKIEKMYRTLVQKACLYCGEEFRGDKGSVLHHTKMWIKQREIKEREKLIEYYKTLEDTDLICVRCHSKEHPGVYRGWRKGQRKLRF